MKPLDYLEAAALSAWAVFAPIHAVMEVTGGLILIDLVTGVMAAKKTGQEITSKGISRTLAKVVLYELALATSFLVHQYMTGDLLPADKLVAGLIGLVELKSILENINAANGTPVFAAIVDRTIAAQRHLERGKRKKKGPPK